MPPSNALSCVAITAQLGFERQLFGRLALESSTLTPLLKRLEAAGLLRPTRNPDNERQVMVALTDAGRALRAKAGCLGDTLLQASGQLAAELGALNRSVKQLRDSIYRQIGGWDLSAE
jgi:DNA-binding MarR family transcriptional regulator